LQDAIGRTELLEQVRFDAGLDLKPVLAATAISAETGGSLRWEGKRNDRPEPHPPLDDAWIDPALASYKSGVPFSLDSRVTNEDRTLGARLAAQIAQYRTDNPGVEGSQITFNLHGTAGQSFGAFATAGMTLSLEGLANDFVGKGLCGGELIIRGRGRIAQQSEAHTLLGNVALYGATSGLLFAAGRAGERFAVRNSGARAIVEGVGDHACEYMTKMATSSLTAAITIRSCNPRPGINSTTKPAIPSAIWFPFMQRKLRAPAHNGSSPTGTPRRANSSASLRSPRPSPPATSSNPDVRLSPVDILSSDA
jgi:hypothetical protein